MNDSGDSQASDFVGDLMSEINAKRLKQAEGTLLLGDGSPVWLQHILSALAGLKEPLEQAFLAILYLLMYESGYYFLDGPHNSSITYDIRLMRLFNNPTLLLKNIKKENSQYITIFSHNLFYPKYIKLVCYTILNVFKEPLMVVNFILHEENKADSFVFEIKPCIVISPTNELKLLLPGCRDLSIKLKTFLYSYKSLICGETYHPHHILALPLHILQMLCKYLDGPSFGKFIQTCKYMYDSFSDDETLWKYHSLTDYRELNKLPRDTWKVHYKYQAQLAISRRKVYPWISLW